MRRFACIGIFVLISAAAFSQKSILFEKVPAWVKDVSYSDHIKDTSSIGGGYYYLLIDQQRHAEKQETFRRYSIKILSEEGLQSASSINESFDPSYEKLIFHSVVIRRGGKTINKLDPNKFEVIRREENLDRHVYDGSLSAILNLDGVQPGDIIDYSYTIRGGNPLFNGIYFSTYSLSFSVPVGKTYYAINASKSRQLHFKYFNTKSEFHTQEGNGFVTYSLEQQNSAALLHEDKTPDWFDPFGRAEVSEFKSWQDLGAWAQGVFQIHEKPNQGLMAKINEIKGSSSKKDDWVRKSIEFVQDEIRYLSFSSGVNSHQPHPPGQVFSQRFGDCKDKSLLLSFMLRNLGIDCNPALVDSDDGKILNDRLPSPWRFDHCIVKINLNDTAYWIDPTITFQRGRVQIRTIPSYYHALVIDKKNTGLEEIPFGLKKSDVHIEEKYSLDEVGTSAKLVVETTFRGQQADNLRENRQATSLEEFNKTYLNFYATDYASIKPLHAVVFEDDVEANTVVTREVYKIDSFWKFDSATHQYSAETYARYLSDFVKTPTTKIRTTPYSLNYPVTVDQVIKIELPEEWAAKDDQKTIESDAVYFNSSTLYDHKKIRLRYFYQTKKESIGANEIREHLEKINDIRNSLSYQLTYKTKSTSSSSFNWPFLIISLVVAIGLFLVLRKLYEFDPEPLSEQRYDNVGGWLILPGIGLFFSPIAAFVQILSAGFFNIIQWKILTDPAFSNYNPKLGFFVLIELLANLILIGYSILMNILFWRKRTSLPRLVVFLYGYSLVLVIVDALVTRSLGLGKGDTESIKSIIQAAVSAAIWIPYFLFADRVKATFTNRL